MVRKLSSVAEESLDIEKIKALVISEVDTRRQQLSELSLKIHANPEVAFQEVKAAGWLTLIPLRRLGLRQIFRAVTGQPSIYCLPTQEQQRLTVASEKPFEEGN